MPKEFAVGIFIGRFQPFHNGHLHALKEALERCDWLVVGIGSSNESGTERNPFSAKARVSMISAALSEAQIDGAVRFMEIPDFGDDAKWADFVLSAEPRIEAVFSGNPKVSKAFSGRGVKLVAPLQYHRDSFRATSIRARIRSGEPWEGCVPAAVAEMLKSGGLE